MSFDDFWKLYPRHQAKKDAKKAWDQLKPDQDVQAQIEAALDWQCQSVQWQRDDGQYIPLPATYLRGERFLDERRSGEDRCQVSRQARSEYDIWREQGCPHTPRCPHFIACRLRSSKAS